MAFVIRVEPIDRDIAVIVNDNLSPKAQSAALADFARQSLAEAEKENESALGAVPPHDTFVDGTQGKSEDEVRPDGVIVYEFKLVTDVIAWIDQELIAHSPVKTGRYQRSHALYADGVETDPDSPVLATRYVFLNTQPYARKIERGESKAAPEGVYEGIATSAAARFGNIAKVSFDYRSAPGGAVGEWAAQKTHSRTRRRSAKTDWLTQQPAIVIEVS